MFFKIYSDFLITNQNRYFGLDSSKFAPGEIPYESISLWLNSANFNPSSLYDQTEDLVVKNTGYLMRDGILLSYKYSQLNELAKEQYCGHTQPGQIIVDR